MSPTALEQEIKKLESDILWNLEAKQDYIQDLRVYGSISSGYFYSSTYGITQEQASERVKKAERMITYYQTKLDDFEARLELLNQLAKVQEVA
jgi:hypothetical protein